MDYSYNHYFLLIYLLTQLFASYTAFKFFHIFYEGNNFGNKIEFLSYIISISITSLFVLIVQIPTLTLLINFILYFLLSFNYK
jgi:hypothetical protein